MSTKQRKPDPNSKRSQKKKAQSKKRSQLQIVGNVPGMGQASVNWGSDQVAPLAKQRAVKAPRQPRIRQNRDTTIVSHREFVMDVQGYDDFATESRAINPGNYSLFPWLADMAPLYETYKFIALRFIYETSKSASTNGQIMMAVDFDAKDAAPENKQEMMSYAGAARGAVWSQLVYNCARHDLTKFVKERYVRDAALTPADDIKTYDLGNFYVATSGCDEEANMGEVYVEYTVEFKTPQGNTPSYPADLFWFAVYSATDVSATTLFAGSAPKTDGDMNSQVIGNEITLPYKGFYNLYYTAVGATAPSAPAFNAPSGGSEIQTGTAGAGTTRMSAFNFYCPTAGATFTQTANMAVTSTRTVSIYFTGTEIGDSTPASRIRQTKRAIRNGRSFAVPRVPPRPDRLPRGWLTDTKRERDESCSSEHKYVIRRNDGSVVEKGSSIVHPPPIPPPNPCREELNEACDRINSLLDRLQAVGSSPTPTHARSPMNSD